MSGHARRWGIGIGVGLWLAAAAAGAQPATIPTQAQNSKNQEVTSTANAAVSVTLTAPTGARAHLYGFAARCSAGTAAVTITDGGTTIWSSSAALISTTTTAVTWPLGLVGGRGQNLVVTLGACGGTALGTLSVQGDVF